MPELIFQAEEDYRLRRLDYAIFMQMLLNGGEYNGKRILSRAS